jgi:hypothetical protein
MTAFHEWLEARIADEDGNESAVARRIGVPPNYVHKWRQGRKPTYSLVEQALRAYGWSDRLSPEASLLPTPGEAAAVEQPRNGRPILVHKVGRIVASDANVRVSYAPESEQPVEVPRSEMIIELCRTSPLWPFIDVTAPLSVFLVAGDSMAPAYANGSWVFAGKPADPATLMDGTPVVLHDKRDGSFTFKNLQWVGALGRRPTEVWGIPATMVGTHNVVKIPRMHAEIAAVALGSWSCSRVPWAVVRDGKA